MSKKGDGVGRIACSQFTELRLPTNGEQKCNLIGQKFDIHALSDIWNTTRSKYILPNPGEALKFSVQETYLDLSQNGKHIHLKSEQ